MNPKSLRLERCWPQSVYQAYTLGKREQESEAKPTKEGRISVKQDIAIKKKRRKEYRQNTPRLYYREEVRGASV